MLLIILGLVFVSIIGAAAFAAYTLYKKTDPTNQDNINMEGAKTAQDFLPFEDVKDGLIVLPNHRYRAYIEVSSLNYHMRTDKEKTAVEASFQTFLNSLSFPISFFIQTRLIDNGKMLEATRRDALQTIQEFPQLTEYAERHLADMEQLNDKIGNNKQKKKYIILPFDDAMSMTELSDEERFDYVLKELSSRSVQVAEHLRSMGLTTRILKTRDVAELIYSTYHRDNYRHIDNIMEGHYLGITVDGESVLDAMSEEERLDLILYKTQKAIETEFLADIMTPVETERLKEAMETIDALRDRLGSYYKKKSFADTENPYADFTLEEEGDSHVQ